MKLKWKYAIGEILIVIIGISIAFALNNWKESNANERQKKQYLENLVLDINEEIKQLETNQKNVQDRLKKIQIVLPFLGVKQGNRDSIARHIFKLAMPINFHPESTTYQTLVNSGDMKLINNFQLRRSLEEHYAFHKQVTQNYKRIEKIHERYLGDFFIHEIDYKNMRNGDYAFLDKQLLSNIILSTQGSYYMILRGNTACIESNKKLLTKVEEELEN